MRQVKPLPTYLHEVQEEIEGYARAYGLDFFPIIYEVLDYKTMNEVAAFGGFPTRYPHWRFGMDYEQLSKGYEFGLQKIYEMVINTHPAYAYLLEGNSLVDQKIVMAHVAGHVDFFKNNYYFSKTNRKMIDGMANHASTIRRHMARHGQDAVEEYIDVALSLENLIDPMSPYIQRQRIAREVEDGDKTEEIPRLRAKGYMDKFINPPEFLEQQKKKIEAEKTKKKKFPEEPQRDVLLFLINNAPLERWQRDVLEIIRAEAYYFAPQAMTKVINEGWACVFSGTYVFTENGLLPMEDVVGEQAFGVYDGKDRRRVYDKNIIFDHETVTMRTRRGLELCGSNNHRVLLADRQTWRRLDELQPGDRVAISGGGDLWPTEPANMHPSGRMVDDELAGQLGVAVAKTGEDRVPDVILRSPEPVVRSFLRALFDTLADCDYTGEVGVTLSTMSGKLAEQVQLLLMNYGILSRRRRQTDGFWHVHVMGASAKVFAERIGFGLERKQKALDAYVTERRWFKEEKWEDEVVSLERGRHDVYDISVEETHRYAAGGFINHNSYWHSKIMTDKALSAAEIIDYADACSGVLATAPGRLNPYKLGIELFRNIEMRWNQGQFGKEWDECDSLAAKRDWDLRLGLGRKKVFEVRRLYNDITFIDEFFTLEFCLEQKFYSFGFNERSGNWEIMTRDFKKVKDQLLKAITNRGQPFIYVEDGNHNNRGELLLRHAHEGVDLDLAQGRDTLKNLFAVWTRPVNLLTRIDNKGKLLRWDESGYSDKSA